MQFGIRLGQQIPIEYVGALEIIFGIVLLIYIRKKAKWYQIKAGYTVSSLFISIGVIFILVGFNIITTITWLISLIIAILFHLSLGYIFSKKASQYLTLKESLKRDEVKYEMKSGCITSILLLVIVVIVVIIIDFF